MVLHMLSPFLLICCIKDKSGTLNKQEKILYFTTINIIIIINIIINIILLFWLLLSCLIHL